MKIRLLVAVTLGSVGPTVQTWAASLGAALPLAQIPPTLKTSLQYALGIMFLIGFPWGVINIWGGAQRLKNGDAEGKMSIVAGIIIAGAGAIMGALFVIFGMTDGVLTPLFN